MVRASPFIHQPDRVARKASDVSAADWLYQRHMKKHLFFFYVYCLGFSLGRKSLYNSAVYSLNTLLNSYFYLKILTVHFRLYQTAKATVMISIGLIQIILVLCFIKPCQSDVCSQKICQCTKFGRSRVKVKCQVHGNVPTGIPNNTVEL